MLHTSVRAETPPNVILILVDDQSWNGTSVRMDPNIPGSASDFYQTPSLESLASQGMRFSNAYSAASVCSPSRAALQTGRSPAQLQMTDIVHTTGVRGFGTHPLTPPEWRRTDQVFDSVETLSDRVKAADPNYVTGHIGKWHVVPNPQTFGYDIAFDPMRSSEIGTEDPGSVFAKTAAAIDFVNDRTNAGEPFFLQVSHFAVHIPVEGQASVIEKYQNLPKGTVHQGPKFAAFTEALDTGVGQLLDHVDSLGISDNTYIIYASDNGARDIESENYPLSGFKTHLMEGGIRTPLFIKGPGIQANSVSRVPVSTVDLYSTVSDLVGNTTPFTEGVEGASLVPLLENAGELPAGMEFLERQYADDGAIFFSQPHNHSSNLGYRVRPMAAVRQGDHKLLRIYGENGNPDRDYLFDLSSTLTETEDNGPQDISAANPSLTAELGTKLDAWLQDTDASLAYDVAEPTEIAWRADQRGDNPNVWRSTNNVDHRWRETFELHRNVDFRAGFVETENHFMNGSTSAFVFDGSDKLFRRFFHVGDSRERQSHVRYPMGEPDYNHSATFEMLFKTEDLNSEQFLFETGFDEAGFSISLGDADGDGSHDEARFRLRSYTGEQLVLTADIDEYSNPTEDFVLLTAVINDDPTDRYIELFVNGSRVGRTDGVLGEQFLYWDRYKYSFLNTNLGGVPFDRDIAASHGDGDPAFTQGGLKGEIASFRFLNYALSGEQVQSSYATLLSEPAYQISATSGDITVPLARPTSVAKGAFEADAQLQILHERIDVLDEQLVVDAVATSNATISVDGVAPLVPTSLPAGTRYSSYLVHFDSETPSAENEHLQGSITFDNPIIGLLVDEATLDATELMMGVAGEFDTQDRSIVNSGQGTFIISEDLRTLQFDLTLDTAELMQFRVLLLSDSALTGDFNGDGVVDMQDYTVWRDNFGANSASLADGNRDGFVDLADYTIWRNNLSATINETLPGDYNGDGTVDSLDYSVWRDSFGSGAGSLADGNRDGFVDLADYTLWRNNLGTTITNAESNNVPEPSSLLILITCLVGVYKASGQFATRKD